MDKGYLCEHICECDSNTALRNKLGHRLKQRCVTTRIWLDEEANQLVWRYKAEVGFSMKTNPPAPLMSRTQPNRPSRFPLGRAMGDGLLKRTLEGRPQKGLLRIPDCIVLNISPAELASMRASGHINWKRLLPIKPNIESVVEIKFEGDKLSPEQRRDYRRIAGPDRFRLLQSSDCPCGSKRRQPAQEPVRVPVTTPMTRDNKDESRSNAPAQAPAPTPVKPQYGPVAAPAESSSMSSTLKTTAAVGGLIVLGIIVIILAPEVAAVGTMLGLATEAAASPSKKEKS